MFRTSQALSAMQRPGEDSPYYQLPMMPSQQTTPAGGKVQKRQAPPSGIRNGMKPTQINSPKLFSARFVATNMATRPDTRASRSTTSLQPERHAHQESLAFPMPTPTTNSISRGQSSSAGVRYGSENPQFDGATVTSVPKQTPRNIQHNTSLFSEKTPTTNLKREKSIQKEVTFAEKLSALSKQTCDTDNRFATAEAVREQPEIGAENNFKKSDYPSTQQYISMSNGRFEQLLRNTGEKNGDFILKQFLEGFEPQAYQQDTELQASPSFHETRPKDEGNDVKVDASERQPPKVKKSSNDLHSQNVLTKLMDILQRRERQEVKKRKRRLDAKTFANFMEMLDNEELEQNLRENKHRAQQPEEGDQPPSVLAKTAKQATGIKPKTTSYEDVFSNVYSILGEDDPQPVVHSHKSTVINGRQAAAAAQNQMENGTQTAVNNPVVCLRFRIGKGQNIQIADNQVETSDNTASSVEEVHHKSRKTPPHHAKPEANINNNGEVTHRFRFSPLNDANQEHNLTLSKKNKPSTLEKRHAVDRRQVLDGGYADHFGQFSHKKSDSDETTAVSENFPTYHDPHAPVQMSTVLQRPPPHPRGSSSTSIPKRHTSEVKIVQSPPILVKQHENSESPDQNLFEIVVQLEVDKENKIEPNARHSESARVRSGNKKIKRDRSHMPYATTRRRSKSDRHRMENSDEETRAESSTSQNVPIRNEERASPAAVKYREGLRNSTEDKSNFPVMPVQHTAPIAPGVLGIGAPRLLGVYYNLTSDGKADMMTAKNAKMTDFDVPSTSQRGQQSQHLLSIAEREAARSFQPPAVRLLIDSHEKYPFKRDSKFKKQATTSSDTDDQEASYNSVYQHISGTSLESDDMPTQLRPKRTKSRSHAKTTVPLKPSAVKPKTITFSPETTTDDQHRHNVASGLKDVTNTLNIKNNKKLPEGTQPYVLSLKHTQSRMNASAVPAAPMLQANEEKRMSSTPTSEDQQQQTGASDAYRRNMANVLRPKKKLSSASVYEQLPLKRTKSRHHSLINPIIAQSNKFDQMREGLASISDDQRRLNLPPNPVTGLQRRPPVNTRVPRSAESQRFSVSGTQPTETSTQESTDKSSAANDFIKTDGDLNTISAMIKEIAGEGTTENAAYNDEGVDYGHNEGSSLMMMAESERIHLNEQKTEAKKSSTLHSVINLPSTGHLTSITEVTNIDSDESSESEEEIVGPDSFQKGTVTIKSETSSHRSDKLSDVEEVASIVADLVSNLGANKLEDIDLKGEEFLGYVKAAVESVKRSKSQLQSSDRLQSTEKSSSSRTMLTSSGTKSKINIRDDDDSPKSEQET